MSGRAKRVFVYTASLLAGPLPVMPFERGTRPFALALVACGLTLALASLYVARGELRLKHRDLLGSKLLASSLITLVFGASLCVGALVWLARG